MNLNSDFPNFSELELDLKFIKFDTILKYYIEMKGWMSIVKSNVNANFFVIDKKKRFCLQS